MRTIAFVTQKGGSGKSTLCVNLAVAAQEAGASVCILEMDRQATDHATGPSIRKRRGAGGRADRRDADRRRDARGCADCDYDYVFIDTPGVDSPGALAAMRAADLCIMPCRPTPADLRAVQADARRDLPARTSALPSC